MFFGTNVNIIDIACCDNAMIALTDDSKVYVWGRRMGLYKIPFDSLTYHSAKRHGYLFMMEQNQLKPRLVSNNLTYYNIIKVKARHSNMCLITDKGELLIQGMNDCGQLLLPTDVSTELIQFPEFSKVDFLSPYTVKDVSIGKAVIQVLCVHKESGEIKVFGWGAN